MIEQIDKGAAARIAAAYVVDVLDINPSEAPAVLRAAATILEKRGPNGKTLPQRFREKYSIDPDTGCWVWGAAKSSGGYGQIWAYGRLVYAHRLSLEMNGVTLSKHLDIDHLCRNRGCVNPDHLEQVPRAINYRRGLEARRGGR